MNQRIDFKEKIEQKIDLLNRLQEESYESQILEVIHTLVKVLQKGGTVFFCGNGGSMSDAAHIAAELSGRFYINRPPLKAICLATNTSYLTAVANDLNYEDIFARELQALSNKGDVLVALSTSGNSLNVINAMQVANAKDLIGVSITGDFISELGKLSDVNIKIPSTDTPRIQETYMFVLHYICEKVEELMFKNS